MNFGSFFLQIIDDFFFWRHGNNGKRISDPFSQKKMEEETHFWRHGNTGTKKKFRSFSRHFFSWNFDRFLFVFFNHVPFPLGGARDAAVPLAEPGHQWARAGGGASAQEEGEELQRGGGGVGGERETSRRPKAAAGSWPLALEEDGGQFFFNCTKNIFKQKLIKHLISSLFVYFWTVLCRHFVFVWSGAILPLFFSSSSSGATTPPSDTPTDTRRRPVSRFSYRVFFIIFFAKFRCGNSLRCGSSVTVTEFFFWVPSEWWDWPALPFLKISPVTELFFFYRVFFFF